jgi:hypothetical protein
MRLVSPCIRGRKDEGQRELVLGSEPFLIAVRHKSQSSRTTSPFDQHAANAAISLAAQTRQKGEVP